MCGGHLHREHSRKEQRRALLLRRHYSGVCGVGRFASKRVLVVDDEFLVALDIKRMLVDIGNGSRWARDIPKVGA